LLCLLDCTATEPSKGKQRYSTWSRGWYRRGHEDALTQFTRSTTKVTLSTMPEHILAEIRGFHTAFPYFLAFAFTVVSIGYIIILYNDVELNPIKYSQ